MANGKARAPNSVYRDEAAELMAAAARGNARPSPLVVDLEARRPAPTVHAEGRPLPYPEPVGFNDNSDDYDDSEPVPRPARRYVRPLRLVAQIVLAPLYVAVALGAVALIVIFARGFF